jgi:hypothetical protein
VNHRAIKQLRPSAGVDGRTGQAGTGRAMHSGMTHHRVEALLGRLVTDPALLERFIEDPATVLDDLRRQGYELTEVETDALASTDAGAIESLASALDRRLRRASVALHPSPQDRKD